MRRLILLIATICLLWGNSVSAQISGGGGGAGGAGDASAANQVTEHGYIGPTTDAAAAVGGEGSLSAKLRRLTTQLDSIQTSVQLLDDAIHASDAALSKVLASGCQFDDTTPGTTTEDSVKAVRCSTRRELYGQIRDAAGNERGANVNASNELQVSLSSVPSHPVTNAGTFATQAAQSGTWTVQPGNTANTTPWLATISQGGNSAAVNASGQLSITCANCSGSGASAVDDAAFTVATDSGAPAMGLFDDVAPDSVNEGDAGVLRMSANRALYVNIRDNAGNERGLNIAADGSLAVTGTVAVTGVSTAANQTTIIGHVDGLETLIGTTNSSLTTIDGRVDGLEGGLGAAADAAATAGSTGSVTAKLRLATSQLDSIKTAVETIDNIVSGSGVNISQINGVAVTMGAGATGTGVQRVNPVSSSATGAAPPAAASFIAGLGSGATGGFLIGIAVGDSFKAVNVSTATTTLLVTGVSGRHVRITSLDLLTAAANNVALISGTGATCGTGTAAMNGGTTAPSGWNFAANGGIVKGNGFGTVLQTVATGDSVCIVTSAATQLSGSLGYAIY